jgi:hypothetical protein
VVALRIHTSELRLFRVRVARVVQLQQLIRKLPGPPGAMDPPHMFARSDMSVARVGQWAAMIANVAVALHNGPNGFL